MFPELALENEEASREEEKGILVYTDDRDGITEFFYKFCFIHCISFTEKSIWLNGYWYPLEKVLHIRAPKNGWVQV